MKEKLYTIPLNDAMNADDECPFCYIERNVEQDILDYVLGSCASYMESDTRDATDKAGFCRMHYKKMFDYGNTLGKQPDVAPVPCPRDNHLFYPVVPCRSGGVGSLIFSCLYR